LESCAATVAHRRHKKSAADCHPPLHLRTVAAFGRKPLNFHAPGGLKATLEQPWPQCLIQFIGLTYSVAGTRLPLVKKRIARLSIGVVIGLFIFAGVIWVLSLSLGDHETLYAGKSLNDWGQQLKSHDAASSNQAYQALNTRIIPALVEQMHHDTNDSKLRLWLIDTLNVLPGVQIRFTEAEDRQFLAPVRIGNFGPPAKAAVPTLIQVLKGPDARLYEPAIEALGNIHSEADLVIPLLISYLTNKDLDDEAATALGNYGSLAREAYPKIVPLLKANDDDARRAAHIALKKIDPEAAAKAGVR